MLPTRRLLLVATPIALLAVAIVTAFWSAQRALTRSTAAARTLHQLSFTLQPLDPATAQSRNPGFDPVASPTAFTSGTILDGTLYLAGPAGLSIYAADGTLRQTLRTGLELPVAPIAAVTSGRLRGATDAQILIATSGAGVLLLDPNPHGQPTLHQLLPTPADAADLTTLLPLPTGDLLLGTRHKGVLLYDGTALAPYPNLPAADITALAAPDSASILVGTRNAGLYYLHAGALQHADATSGLPDNQIESLALANHRAFAGTPLGTAQFDLAAPDSAAFKPTRILAPGLFAHALSASASELEVGSLDQGIQQLPLGDHPRLRNAAYLVDPPFQPAQRIDAFLSATYALADGALLARTNSGWRPALSTSAATLADRNISALAFAPDGALYVGFFDHGLDILHPDAAQPIRHLEDDHLFCINRLALDPDRQTIAAATANGLVLFDRQHTPRQTLTQRDGLISDHVTDVAFTSTGTTIATPAGLTFLTPSGAQSLYAFQGLVNNHVYTLGSSNTALLAGTLGGISILSGNTIQRNLTATNSALKHNWITALAPAPQGGWLVGTYGAGMLTLSADGNTILTPDLPAGTPRDLVINPNALLVTRTHVYAGTLGHGMLVLSLATNRWSLVTAGLPSLNVTAFAARNGELYIGTENGLIRIPEAKL